jgi:dTDP-4-dehydrorhamnose reductase
MGKTDEGPSAGRKHFMRSVAIIGPNGQLGVDLVKTFTLGGWDVLPVKHQDIQVEKIDSVRNFLKDSSVDWIINTAAFHKVDECERNSEKAWLINASGAANIAQVANELSAKSVFISSDYVFSGLKETGSSYTENDPVSPINVYGHSKAAGEVATLSANPDNLVFRISSVFGAAGSSGKGGNFVEAILKKARAAEPLNVVNDIHMSPSYAVDVSLKIFRTLEGSYSGLVHASNSGSATWYTFANKILELAKLKTLVTATQTDMSQPPRRPINSALEVSRVEALTGLSHSWEDALRRYLIEKGHIK